MKKSNKKNMPSPANHTENIGDANAGRQLRCGNYSCIGYQKLEVPQSEAEKSNMPFIDPEFTYDSIS
jgi:hypothetical protein